MGDLDEMISLMAWVRNNVIASAVTDENDAKSAVKGAIECMEVIRKALDADEAVEKGWMESFTPHVEKEYTNKHHFERLLSGGQGITDGRRSPRSKSTKSSPSTTVEER